ncbi:metal ABC transporter solute-binding protein, Zn/Mn family [Dietzia aurantiaca]|uniref:metal ABC transporter solute-binding protein, Zn/Mn family n=1 Tax=Dietzia aurantiaca TaxID=983873 RepID=UPI001E52778A|nr:zinc ABC transporter substrate-binding protein [Dietzia aurantiaca]
MSTSRPASRQPRRAGLSRTLAVLATALLGAGALTACGGASGTGPADGDGPSVVASTTVYADIARQVAGGNAEVESVISDPAADPHSYEAGPADAARVATADLVVYNGGGYDSFVDLALANAGDVPVVRAVDEYSRVTGEAAPEHSHDHGDDAGHEDHTGHDHGHSHDSETNEHVWFSLPTTAAVAERVAEQLSELDPEHAEEYRANARDFGEELSPLRAQLDEIHERGHFPYAQTERIGAHLFDYAHMVDLTPRGFLSSVEDDTDPAAADLAALIDLLHKREVAFLAFNSQTETAVTARVRDAAVEAGVVVVDLTETLPDGTDYLTWMRDIVAELTRALSDATPEGDGGH